MTSPGQRERVHLTKGLSMRLGTALTLIALGAILEFAVAVRDTHGFDVNPAGAILKVVGIVGLLAELAPVSIRRRTDVIGRTPVAPTAYEARY
jgi:hypothetical protein